MIVLLCWFQENWKDVIEAASAVTVAVCAVCALYTRCKTEKIKLMLILLDFTRYNFISKIESCVAIVASHLLAKQFINEFFNEF